LGAWELGIWYKTLGAWELGIKLMKKEISSNFSKKRIKHEHQVPCDKCNKILVFDGNWKTNRLKCSYDNLWRKSEAFGSYKVGCPNTPERLSYFCIEHRANKLVFEVDTGKMEFNPDDITLSRISVYLYEFG
jgi:hypothetical protein